MAAAISESQSDRPQTSSHKHPQARGLLTNSHPLWLAKATRGFTQSWLNKPTNIIISVSFNQLRLLVSSNWKS